MKKKIFWKEDFQGEATGGFYVRNDLFKFIKKIEESGRNPIGIIIDDDWNLEVLVESTPK